MPKRILLALLTAALIAGCALLPSTVALWQDHRQLGRIETETIEPISLRNEDVSLVDRLRLCSRNELYCEVQTMSIGTGVRYQEDTVVEQARTQLAKLCEAGILTLDPAQYTGKAAGVDFLADPGDPANNALVWQIEFYGETGMLQALVDDASGLIIMLVADDNEKSPASWDLARSIDAWAAYLGLSEVEAADTDSDRLSITEAEKYGYSKKDLEAVLLSYGSATLAHPDDPDGFTVQYLMRVSHNTFWLTIA